jgi:hypothetical protein
MWDFFYRLSGINYRKNKKYLHISKKCSNFAAAFEKESDVSSLDVKWEGIMISA